MGGYIWRELLSVFYNNKIVILLAYFLSQTKNIKSLWQNSIIKIIVRIFTGKYTYNSNLIFWTNGIYKWKFLI